MSGLLLFCIVSALVSFIVFLVGLSLESNETMGCGIIAMVMIGIFGFFIGCNVTPIKHNRTILMPDEIAKSQYTLFVKCEGRQFESTEARFVMASNDLIRVEKKEGINSYNNVCETSYVLVLSDGGSK